MSQQRDAASVIGEVVRSGARLWREGDKLRLRAPERDIAESARKLIAPARDDVLAALRPGSQYFPLSSAQQRLWLVDRLAAGSSVYNIPLALLLEGELDRARLSSAIGALAARHEALRTRVETFDGQPVGVAASEATIDLVARDDDAARWMDLLMAEAERPFDLRHEPPLRAALFRIETDRHALLINLHHLAADGWSLGLILNELGQAYASGDGLASLPATASFSDLVCGQHTATAARRRENAIRKGMQWIEDYPVELRLPRDRPRPAVPTSRGGRLSRALSRETSRAWLAVGEGSTLFAALLAALGLWCHRVGGQDRLLIGAAVAGRNDPAAAAVVGPFANILALPCDFRGEPTVRDILRRARETIGAAIELDELPFEALVELLNGRVSRGAPALVQATIGVDMETPATPSFGLLRTQRIALAQRTAKFDFSVEASLDGEIVVLDFGYSLDLFDESTAIGMADSLIGLIEEAAKTPNARIGDLPESAALAACRDMARIAAPPEQPACKELSRDDDDAPLSPREAVIAAAMEAVLGVDDIRRNDNFFAAGGHSLLAMRFVERLRERDRLDLPLKEVMLGRGVAELAAAAKPIDTIAPARETARPIEDLSDAELDQMLSDLEQWPSNGG